MVCAGGITGIFSWGICFPLDCFKTLAQTESFTDPKFKGYTHMVSTVLRTKGVLSLYNGLKVCLMRGFPVNAITFLFYEISRDQIMGFTGAKELK